MSGISGRCSVARCYHTPVQWQICSALQLERTPGELLLNLIRRAVCPPEHAYKTVHCPRDSNDQYAVPVDDAEDKREHEAHDAESNTNDRCEHKQYCKQHPLMSSSKALDLLHKSFTSLWKNMPTGIAKHGATQCATT